MEAAEIALALRQRICGGQNEETNDGAGIQVPYAKGDGNAFQHPQIPKPDSTKEAENASVSGKEAIGEQCNETIGDMGIEVKVPKAEDDVPDSQSQRKLDQVTDDSLASNLRPAAGGKIQENDVKVTKTFHVVIRIRDMKSSTFELSHPGPSLQITEKFDDSTYKILTASKDVIGNEHSSVCKEDAANFKLLHKDRPESHESACEKVTDQCHAIKETKSHESACEKVTDQCHMTKETESHESACEKVTDQCHATKETESHESACEKVTDQCHATKETESHEFAYEKVTDQCHEAGEAERHEFACEKVTDQCHEAGEAECHESACEKVTDQCHEAGEAESHESACEKVTDQCHEAGEAESHESACEKVTDQCHVTKETESHQSACEKVTDQCHVTKETESHESAFEKVTDQCPVTKEAKSHESACEKVTDQCHMTKETESHEFACEKVTDQCHMTKETESHEFACEKVTDQCHMTKETESHEFACEKVTDQCHMTKETKSHESACEKVTDQCHMTKETESHEFTCEKVTDQCHMTKEKESHEFACEKVTDQCYMTGEADSHEFACEKVNFVQPVIDLQTLEAEIKKIIPRITNEDCLFLNFKQKKSGELSFISSNHLEDDCQDDGDVILANVFRCPSRMMPEQVHIQAYPVQNAQQRALCDQVLCYEFLRLMTFRMPEVSGSILKIAAAGFYYFGESQVKCFSCGKLYNNFLSGIPLINAHEPRCRWLDRNKPLSCFTEGLTQDTLNEFMNMLRQDHAQPRPVVEHEAVSQPTGNELFQCQNVHNFTNSMHRNERGNGSCGHTSGGSSSGGSVSPAAQRGNDAQENGPCVGLSRETQRSTLSTSPGANRPLEDEPGSASGYQSKGLSTGVPSADGATGEGSGLHYDLCEASSYPGSDSREAGREMSSGPECTRKPEEIVDSGRDTLLPQAHNVVSWKQAQPLSDSERFSLCQTENVELKKMFSCIDCDANSRNWLFFPCHHVVVCKKCGEEVLNCPLCRRPIDKGQEVYKG